MKKMIYSIAIALSAVTLTGCSDDKFEGDVAKDWAATTEFFNSTEENGYSTYYTPAIGRVGDPMPFYDEKAGEYKVLYLQEFNNNAPFRYHPIWTVATKDGANYHSLGETLGVGSSDFQQDAALGTGCCYYNKQDGLYYIYYTGHNPNCENTEVVLRATSPDYKTWTRDNSWSLKGADYNLSKNDFRDPQIFEDNGVYHMVIATRQGDPKFADFTSTDMKNWEFAGSFNAVWDRMCECPDIFKMGDWWYFIYSEGYQTTWSRKVKYMMAKSFEGLKACFGNPGANWPKDGHEGILDSRAFYAGKTASNGSERLIWGWCPFRSGANVWEKNINVGEKEPNWSGALVCHKIIQHADGTLTLGKVDAIDAKYTNAQDVKVVANNGYTGSATSFKLSGDNAFAQFARLGNHNKISFTVKADIQEVDNDIRKLFGISFVRGGDSKKYYTIVVNREGDITNNQETSRKINFEEEGAEGKGFIEGIDGYWFARPTNDVYNVTIYTDNSVLTMYINDVCAYTQRIYGMAKNCWSINNYGVNIDVTDLTVSQY